MNPAYRLSVGRPGAAAIGTIYEMSSGAWCATSHITYEQKNHFFSVERAVEWLEEQADLDKFLTTRQVAALAQVAPSTVVKWIHAHKLAATKGTAGQWLVARGDALKIAEEVA